MMPKHTSDAEPGPVSQATSATPIQVTIVTLDGHLAAATERAQQECRKDFPGLSLSLHSAAEWSSDPDALARCRTDIASADILVVTMLFMEDHIQAVLPDLRARRDHCDALVVCMSAGEVIKLTRLGGFTMDGSQRGPLSLLKRLRGSGKSKKRSAGAQQMAMLRRLPKILKYIPGTAQDVRAYFLTLQYWLAGSDENVANLVRFLIDRYATGPRRALRGVVKAALPTEYPENGVYHPQMNGRLAESVHSLPKPRSQPRATVGLLLMRSYLLAGNTAHYDAVIRAFEERGIRVIPAFASGLDARPAVEAFFTDQGAPTIDALVSLTGFSLVGGPAYNDADAAKEMLQGLDVPYIAGHAIEFQTMEQWQHSDRGLLPVESTIMVAIPELDGATCPTLFGGRSSAAPLTESRNLHPHPERIEQMVERVDRLVQLRKTPRAERQIGIVLFNFPPNAGATGTAAHLSVFESLHRTLRALAEAGYTVEVPETVDALRARVTEGNAARYGCDANVHAQIPVDDHVRREPWLREIETQWGPAPGRHLTDGRSLFVLGERLGNVLVAVQPGFGYEGDPMRLLFERGFAPTHAFSAFYRYLREDFGAHAVLHFGTHGALEFMPGKQAGMSADCWPERLIGPMPNLYLYAANNPSEGTIAKRRAAATLVSYLTPPIAHAGLYRGLHDLRASIERWRALDSEHAGEREPLAQMIQTQAAQLDLARDEPAWGTNALDEVERLRLKLDEYEQTLIPHGLHIVGEPPSPEERVDLLEAMAEASAAITPPREAIASLVAGATPAEAIADLGLPEDDPMLTSLETLVSHDRLLAANTEGEAIVRALDGRFIAPAPGGDLLRTPEILPTGRNLHGFDPFRIPSAFATTDGRTQAERLLACHRAECDGVPESIALVLWGTDNLKTEGGPIAQALALLGAEPRFDSYGRVAGANLIPLESLGRPRIDVVMTLSGIFRDLLPLQTRMLAEAAYLAAAAENEPLEMNFVRKHTLAYQQAQGCDFETATLRVFSNADGAYGSNVNQLIDSGSWDDEDELAEAYTRRKCFAYGRDGGPVARAELLKTILSDVHLAYQNLESVELGVTTVDHYFDTLGGISGSVRRAKGEAIPVYIGDQTHGEGKVRTLGEQVSLEARTRMLNPKWYEGMLRHGYEGVRQIEAHVTNTMGWSATTGQVASWVYQHLTETFVLDEAMRKRLADLNPAASAKVANRLIEAYERNYWQPDQDTLEALRQAGEELEDKLEGIDVGAAA